jgi:hypothetical protein
MAISRHEAKIEKVSNGYICITYVPETDDTYTVNKELFEEPTDNTAIYTGTDTEITSFVSLVQFLADYFGVGGSKHDAERLWVGRVNKKGKRIL